jgi:hypothetical protein
MDRRGKERTGMEGSGMGMPLVRGPCRKHLEGFFLHGMDRSGWDGTGWEWKGVERHGHDPLARAMQKAPYGVLSAWKGKDGNGKERKGQERHGHDPLARAMQKAP